jgi:hypothetical protein
MLVSRSLANEGGITRVGVFTGVQFGKREKKIRLEEERRRVETN